MNSKLATISPFTEKTNQLWFGTTKDSQIKFSNGWYDVADVFKLYNDKDKFDGGKYFEMGKNGGSYALNFNKKDLNVILKILKQEGYTVKYEVDVKGSINKKVITKKEFIETEIEEKIDNRTAWLAGYMN